MVPIPLIGLAKMNDLLRHSILVQRLICNMVHTKYGFLNFTIPDPVLDIHVCMHLLLLSVYSPCQFIVIVKPLLQCQIIKRILKISGEEVEGEVSSVVLEKQNFNFSDEGITRNTVFLS